MAKTINNYQIVSKIASGGMSEVYLAKDINTGKKVALKILDAKLSIDPEYLGRFKKEASICKQLDHENIVRIISYGTFNDSYYIAYEYIQGITLDKYIKQQSLSISQIENISVQILKALSYAHTKNIIHRDIKPSNIIIEGNTVKILDFGIAKQQLAATVTKTGLFMGSPHYVSPEQIEGHDIDNRSDIYSFGIVLYEMIQGTVPFSAETPWGIIRAHLDKKEPEITKDVPIYLKEVVSKCLSKRKQDRFKNADDIISVILNKEEIGRQTVIIDRERINWDEGKWEKLEKALEEESKIEGREEKRAVLKPLVISLGVITTIFIIIIIIVMLKNGFLTQGTNNTKNITQRTTEISQTTPTTTIQTIIETKVTSSTSAKETKKTVKTATTTDYEKIHQQDLAEESFLNKMSSLLDEYNSTFNHMNTYHKEGWIFNDPNEIALETTFLIKLQEYSNKLENFSFPSSISKGRGNLLNISKQLCEIENLMIECMKNDDYEGCLFYFKNFWNEVDNLWNNYNSMVSKHNNKYH